MATINQFLLTTGIKGTLGVVASQFAITFGEQLLEQLKNEHKEMKDAFAKVADPISQMATA